jgi:Na+-translocating ferredoxin:NAD+ oxidoreductase subunit B
MENSDSVYMDLQKHLDKQAVGFPTTKSGVEIRLLKELFTPEQAGLVLHLSYQPQSEQDIFAKVKENGMPFKIMKSLLEAMDVNGTIGVKEKNGIRLYFTIPLLIGIAELHWAKATPQYRAYFGEYMRGEFGTAFVSTRVSQMRTIPVEKSLHAEHHVASYDQIREVINSSPGPFSIGMCMCREGARQRGQPCKTTSRTETCMAIGDWASRSIKAGRKEITREEAMKVIDLNEADGLVLQPNNSQKVDFLCSCCGCCCGVLNLQKRLPKPAANWTHSFYAVVDEGNCTACGICAEKCQMKAIIIDEQAGHSVINLDRCFGCGNCVAVCPSEALALARKEKGSVPPEESTDLYKILVEG